MSKMPENEFKPRVEVSPAALLLASMAPFGEQFTVKTEKPRRISLRDLVADYDERGVRR